MKILNLDSNAQNLQRIAKRVMQDRNMRITKSFVPAESRYSIPVDANHKVEIFVGDDSLIVDKMAKIGNRWERSVSERLWSTSDKVNYALAKALKSLGVCK